jgi:hypothetical protein
VQDPFQGAASDVVRKHHVADGGTIEAAIFANHGSSEEIGDPPESCRAGCDGFAGQHIRIDDGNAGTRPGFCHG